MKRRTFIELRLRPSYRLALILVTSHIAAMTAVAILPAPIWIRATLSTILLFSVIYVTRTHALSKGGAACLGLRLANDGRCELQTPGGVTATGMLLPGHFVSPALIVLRVRVGEERWPRSVVLLPDSAETDSLRRLRVFLRINL